MTDEEKSTDECLRALLRSDYDFLRELQSRRALHAHMKCCERKYFWDALQEDICTDSSVEVLF